MNYLKLQKVRFWSFTWLICCKDLKKMNIKNSRLEDTVTRYDALLAEIQAALIADIKEKEAIIHSIQSVCNKFEISL